MPELPEVETTRRGVAPYITDRVVTDVCVRQSTLRWPVPPDLTERLTGQCLQSIERRAKYLLLDFSTGWLMIHLGMSGSLRVLTAPSPIKKHDHIDIDFDGGATAGGVTLRYHDPRRFGSFLWIPDHWSRHPLLAKLGPEPLDVGFDANYLWARLKSVRQPIKPAIMDQSVVVGVGNIYASESLFRASIHPQRPANSLTIDECALLVGEIRLTLESALASGGSTLRDYVNSQGDTGYFQLSLQVYDRGGEPCLHCGTPVSTIRLAQRSTFFCVNCQPFR